MHPVQQLKAINENHVKSIGVNKCVPNLYIKSPSFWQCVLNKCTHNTNMIQQLRRRDLLSTISCTQTCHWTLTVATAIHSLPSHPISLKVHFDMLLHALPH
jgi:hypothetical protein